MSEEKFLHYDLKLLEPTFGSSLTDLIIDLDYLRRQHLSMSTHPKVFFQLKHIFHTLESISSARIEGNNTTIAEYIEGTRKYVLRFDNNYLLRGVIKTLGEKGFLPVKE